MSLCRIKLRSSHKEQTANSFQRVMQQTDPKPGARHVLLCRCVQAESFPTVPLSGRHTDPKPLPVTTQVHHFNRINRMHRTL